MIVFFYYLGFNIYPSNTNPYHSVVMCKNYVVGALWVCIVLNPHCSVQEKQHWKSLLEKWTHNEVCPQEDPDFRPQPLPRLDGVSYKHLVSYWYNVKIFMLL